MTSSKLSPAREQAADWVTKIQSGEVNPQDCEELRMWLNDSPDHQRCFQSMLDVLSKTDRLANMPLHDSTSPVDVERIPRALWSAAAAVALVAVGLAFWLSPGSGERLQTYTGERLLMPLEDGSSIHLNANSSVNIRFTDSERIARMQGGEIVFDVEKDDPRPFIVHSNDLDVEVTGTLFQVSRYDDDTLVSVLEGSVTVIPNDSAAGTSGDNARRGLRAGEQIRLEGGTFSELSFVDVSRVAAWRDGWIVVDERPLRELVDRLNRQFDGQIEIEDVELARSRVSVALKVGQRAETLSQLELLLPIRFETLPGERHIVRAQP